MWTPTQSMFVHSVRSGQVWLCALSGAGWGAWRRVAQVREASSSSVRGAGYGVALERRLLLSV